MGLHGCVPFDLGTVFFVPGYNFRYQPGIVDMNILDHPKAITSIMKRQDMTPTAKRTRIPSTATQRHCTAQHLCK